MKDDHRYDYSDAGFNRFYRRSIGSNANAETLGSLPPAHRSGLNFDDQQVSGGLGDTLRIGTILLDGKNGRMSIHDSTGLEIGRIGNLDG